MQISQLKLDLIECTLTCVTTADPNLPEEAFRVDFKDVGNVKVSRYHDADDVSLGDFERFSMRMVGSAGRAIFETNTGDAFLSFEASNEPLIIPISWRPKMSDVFERID